MDQSPNRSVDVPWWYIALTNDTSVPIFYRTVEALLTDDKTSADRVKVIKSTPAERVNVLQVLVGGNL